MNKGPEEFNDDRTLSLDSPINPRRSDGGGGGVGGGGVGSGGVGSGGDPPPSKRFPPDFGDYRFFERMGQGSFGEVFKVWSSSKQRYEAMKILHGVNALDGEQLASFSREVQRMANISAVHVAHVYHSGVTPDGRPFFTMEFVDGGRLDDYCDRNQKSIEVRIRAVADICEEVQRLHKADLFHCDIKPGNIVVTEESGVMIPKLVDFGIASHKAFTQSPQKTARGTLLYMSPEQLDSHGGKPEESWDIYSLGVTLYELIVGECPIEVFPEPFLPLEVHADYVRKTPIPPLVEKLTSSSRKRPDELALERRLNTETLRNRLCDTRLQAVVEKALCKRKEDRYASAGEMALNLRQYLAGRRPPIVPPTIRDRTSEFLRDHWLAVATPTILALLVVLISWTYFSQLGERKAQADSLIAQAESLVAQGRSEGVPFLAIEKFEKALKLTPNDSDTRLHLAGAHVTSGNAEEALRIANFIPKGDPNYGHAQALIHGINQFRSYASDGHVSDIDARIEVSPGEEYYYSLTFGPKKAKSAIELLDRALENHAPTLDDRFRIRMMRAMRYYQLQDFDSLDKESQWLVGAAPESAVVQNLRGLACWNTDHLTAALESFDKAIQINPEYATAYQNRAGFLMNKLKRCSAALKDCEHAVELSPAHEPYVEDTRIYALMCLGKLGDKSRSSTARTRCEALSTKPMVTAQTHTACGILWETLELHERQWDEFDRAVSQLEQEGEINTVSAYLAILNRGDAATKVGRYANAIHDLNRAAEMQPQKWREDPANPVLRGLAYTLANKHENAIADWKEAAQIMKDSKNSSGGALIYLWIWDVHLSGGRPTEAAEALQQAKSAAQGDERIRRIVEHCSGAVDREALLKDAGNDPTKQIETYYIIGLAAKARGDFKEARHWFGKYRELDASENAERDLAEMQLGLPWNNP